MQYWIVIHRKRNEDHERGPFCLGSKYWQSLYRRELLSFKEGYCPHIGQQHTKSLNGYLNAIPALRFPARPRG